MTSHAVLVQNTQNRRFSLAYGAHIISSYAIQLTRQNKKIWFLFLPSARRKICHYLLVHRAAPPSEKVLRVPMPASSLQMSTHNDRHKTLNYGRSFQGWSLCKWKRFAVEWKAQYASLQGQRSAFQLFLGEGAFMAIPSWWAWHVHGVIFAKKRKQHCSIAVFAGYRSILVTSTKHA